jgi:5-methylcytosine-specific restriction endonuclease McrA
MATRSGVPQSLRRQLLRECGYRCAMCGIQGREIRQHNKPARNACFSYPTSIDGVWLSIDHVIPRSHGGDSERSNLRVLCTTCNGLRGAPSVVVHDTQAVEEHW